MGHTLRKIAATLVLAVLLVSATPTPGGAVYIGKRVEVEALDDHLVPGESTPVTVLCKNRDGDPYELANVTLIVERGTYTPEYAHTGANGICVFTYTAPQTISGIESVTIIAAANMGEEPYPTDSTSITITYRLDVSMEGPRQVERGGPTATYNVTVKAGGEPTYEASIQAVCLGIGSIGTVGGATDEAGRTSFEYIPPTDSTGNTQLRVTASKHGYQSGSRVISVNVVEELGPLELVVEADVVEVPSWGSCNLTATLTRSGYPVPDAIVTWQVSNGWLSEEETETDEDGVSTVHYTATGETPGRWSGNVRVTVTANDLSEVVEEETYFPVVTRHVIWEASIGWNSEKRQLFGGEELWFFAHVHQSDTDPVEFIAGLKVDLVIYEEGGEEYFRTNLAEGLNLDSGFSWTYELQPVFTVPGGIAGGTYYCDVLALDVTGTHVYGSLSSQVELNLQPTGKEDDWTFLIFLNGDNDIVEMADYAFDKWETEAPEGEFRVIVQYDRTNQYHGYHDWEDVRRYELVRHGSNREIDSELVGSEYEMYTMGSSETLYRFMQWGSAFAPAGHYCLVIWDHGGAYTGISWDCDPRPVRNIDVHDLKLQLDKFAKSRRKMDVVVFDACLMSSLEVAIELRHSANYMIGAEEIISCDILEPKAFEFIRAFYPDNRPIPIQLGSDILAGFYDRWGHRYPVPLIELGRVDQMIEDLNSVCDGLLDNWEYLGWCFDNAYDRVGLIRGPSGDNYWLMDAGNFFELLKEELLVYIADPVGNAAVSAVGDLLESYDAMMVNAITKDGFTGVNLFRPPTQPIWSRQNYYYYDELDLQWSTRWDDLLRARFYGVPQDDDEPGQTFPSQMGYVDFPLDSVVSTILDGDSDGVAEGIDVTITIDQVNNTKPVVVITDGVSYGHTKGGEVAPSINTRRYWTVPPGEKESKTFTLNSPKRDLMWVVVTVLTEGGTLLDQVVVGNYSMAATTPPGSPPVVKITPNRTELLAGEEFSATAIVTDPDGDDTTTSWVVEPREGTTLNTTFVLKCEGWEDEGNKTVYCIVSDRHHVVVEHVNVTVLPREDNGPPEAELANETAGQAGPAVRLSAEGSTDPDSDELKFRFNFGDGNWTGWQASPVAEHVYADGGNYTCEVMVRDTAGGRSHTTLVVDVEDIVNLAPEGDLDLSDQEVEVGQILTADASGSSDPEGDTLEYRFEWGDGNVTDWSGDASATHIYAAAGTFTIILWLRDPFDHQVVTSASVNVREVPINNPPTAMLTLNHNRVQLGAEVRADASGSRDVDPGDVLEYRVRWGDGNESEWVDLLQFVHEYKEPGTYTVSLDVRDTRGLVATANREVQVLAREDGGDEGFMPGLGAAGALLAALLGAVVRRRSLRR